MGGGLQVRGQVGGGRWEVGGREDVQMGVQAGGDRQEGGCAGVGEAGGRGLKGSRCGRGRQ